MRKDDYSRIRISIMIDDSGDDLTIRMGSSDEDHDGATINKSIF